METIDKKMSNKSMSDFETLRESKVAYEYILDILESSEIRMNTIDANQLRNSMEVLNNIYSCAYNNLDNPNKKELLITDACCKNCNNNLLISDNINYSYQCLECDENFYDFEAISNDVWYKDEKKEHNLLPSSFDIYVSFYKNDKKVYIGSDCGSGAKYDCNNSDEFVEAMKIYCNNYLTSEELMDKKYSIEIWETEWHRDAGEGFIYSETYDDFESALKAARKLYDKNNYASIEILNENNEALYCCDETSEDFYFDNDRFSCVDKSIVNEYVNNWTNKKDQSLKVDKLYCRDNDIFIAVDNSTGNCWVEEFDSEKDAQNWLLGIDLEEGLENEI